MAKNSKSMVTDIDKGIRKKVTGINKAVREKFRRFLVSLKKNPQVIPLLVHTVAFLIFSLNLTDISNTTAKIYGKHMGLCAFVVMLFSILTYVCLFSAFPKRKKPSIPMLAIIFVLYAAIIFADIHYYGRIIAALTREVSPIEVTEVTAYISVAEKVIIAHIIAVCVSAVTIALEPVYARLLKKINTTVELEYTADIDSIDISDEE